MQSDDLYQRAWPLASVVSAPVASMGVRVYLDLCPISLALQPAPLLLPPPPPPLLLPKLSFLFQQLLGTLEDPVIQNDGGLPLPRLLPQSPVLTASAHRQGLLTFALVVRRFLRRWRQGRDCGSLLLSVLICAKHCVGILLSIWK